MQIFLAFLVWFLMAFVIGLAIWLFAVKGVVWFLALVTIAFVGAIWKIGCTAH